MEKRVTRLYTGPDSESHFDDIEIPLEMSRLGRQSQPIKTTGIIFRESDGQHESDWHNAPCRQFYIMLSGQIEIEIGDGTKRSFGPGDLFLAEDTTGRGHIARTMNRRAIVVPLA